MAEPRDDASGDILILVDSDDREIGSASKRECHDDVGMLHRAFSILIFDADGRLLMQQRAAGKRLWPKFWSNSCCSHPRQGETMQDAVARRLRQELGMSAELRFVYKFEYHAKFEEMGSERELCSVWIGKSDDEPKPNADEIAAWRFIEPGELDRELEQNPDSYTPWFQQEWQRLRGEFRPVLDDL